MKEAIETDLVNLFANAKLKKGLARFVRDFQKPFAIGCESGESVAGQVGANRQRLFARGFAVLKNCRCHSIRKFALAYLERI
jgi:hypothetical protein